MENPTTCAYPLCVHFGKSWTFRSNLISAQDGLDGTSQQETTPLFLPQLNQLHELSFVQGKDTSNVVDIPTQDRVTQQILNRWQPFKDLKQTFAVSRRAE